jgi:hypothetical protein
VAKQETRSMTMDIENNQRGVITQLTFKTWDRQKFTELEPQDAKMSIALWMMRSGKNTTYSAEAAKGTGISKSTVNDALQSSGWFEKAPKQGNIQPYRINEVGASGVDWKEESDVDETQ